MLRIRLWYKLLICIELKEKVGMATALQIETDMAYEWLAANGTHDTTQASTSKEAANSCMMAHVFSNS